MTTLTEQEMAEVANTVQPHGDYKTEDMRWCAHISGNVYLYKEGETFSSYAIWNPEFDEMQQRSQALAVVEWLADKIDTIGVYGQVFDQKLRDEKWREVKRAVRNKDTTALQRMVLELKRGR